MAGRHELPIPDGAPYKELAEYMRAQRRASGLTLQEVADRCGRAKSTMSKACSGHVLPSLEVFEDFMRICGGETGVWRKLYRQSALQQVPEVDRETAGLPLDLSRSGTLPNMNLVHTLEAFTDALLQVKIWIGNPSPRAIEKDAKNKKGLIIPHNSLYTALSGKRPPAQPLVQDFLTYCDITDRKYVDSWGAAWERVTYQHMKDKQATRRIIKSVPKRAQGQSNA